MEKLYLFLLVVACATYSDATYGFSPQETFSTATACEHQANVHVSCPGHYVIHVLSAFYGRDDTTTCGGFGVTDCRAESSENIIKATCENENSCTLAATNSLFGDPCHGIVKFIKMQYRCVPSTGSMNAIACERRSDVHVDCPTGEIINVLAASYGRRDTSTCYDGNEIDCHASNSLSIIRDECQDESSCVLQPTNSIFGDPCYGVGKYLKMVYECVPSEPLSAVACEHQSQEIVECEAGKVIDVEDAFYGRQDAHTCGYNSDTNCYAVNSLDYIKRQCHRQSHCVLNAANSIFGDPCYGVGKYINLDYHCVTEDFVPEFTEIVCEHHSAETISCPEGKILLIKEGFYGRLDVDTCPGNVYTTNCQAEGSLVRLRADCNLRNSCELSASNSVFGDPCIYTNKYLAVKYACIDG